MSSEFPQPSEEDANTRGLADRLLADRLRHGPAPAESSGPYDPEALSAAQERMWFLHQMRPDCAAYNVTTAARLTGTVDEQALRRALGELVRRHELLRCRFDTTEDGRPRRVRMEVPDVGLLVCAEADAEAVLSRHAELPFDLTTGPLFRALLVHTGPGQHVLALVLHHIIVDGWSLGVLHRDLRACYQSELDGLRRKINPDEGIVDFAEAVRRERRWLSSADGAACREYWRNALADLPAVELPLARPRPPVARFAGSSVDVRAPESTARGVWELARKHACTPYMVALAGFLALLHRYSGQDDIAVGSPVANRHDPDVVDMVGLFVNTLVIRGDLSGAPVFTELMRRVRDTFLAALDHQRMPFEQLVSELSPERSLSHTPLVQVMFALQDAVSEPLTLPGTTAETLRPRTTTTRFDLECTLWREAAGLRIRLTYNVDVLEHEVIDRFARQYAQLLREIVEHPDHVVTDLAVLDDSDHRRLRASSIGPRPKRPSECLHGWFERTARGHRSAIAVCDRTTELRFGELDTAADSVAAQLIELGVRPGEVVAVLTERSCDLVIAVLGVLKAAAAFLPLNPDDPIERRRFLLRDAQAVAVLVDRRHTDPTHHDGRPTVVVPPEADSPAPARPRRPVRPDDLAYVLYTSGTSGRPKGVAVEHRNVVNTLAACHERFGFAPQDTGLVLAPQSFDVCYYELFSVLLAGGRARLVDREELFDPERVAAVLAGATSLQAVPGLMEHLRHCLAVRGVRALPDVRLVVTGGDSVPPALLDALRELFPRAELAVTYGPTETAIFCTAHVVSGTTRGHPIGTPLAGCEVWVADERGRPLPEAATGELWIGGQGVARGYLNRPDETRARFAELDGKRFYRSGDRGRWRSDGELEFLGRTDQQVKVRGFRIELGEVDAVLAEAPEVRQAVTIVDGEGASTRHLTGYVVAEPKVAPPGAEQRAVRTWRALFDETHAVPVEGHDRDFTGWNSSYDRRPLPRADMDDWLDSTVRRLHAKLAGGAARPKVLEIGCGTGLVLRELAGTCARYVGTDFSESALRGLRRVVRERGWEHVELIRAEAGELTGLESDFDAVVINSVSQYLPSARHLREVLRAALARTSPDGFVFVGDVRHLPLLPVFLCSLEEGSTDVLGAAHRRIADEDELVLSPAFFTDLQNELPGLSGVEVEPRGGRRNNELTRYRFDVTLWRARAHILGDTRWHEWSRGWDEAALSEALAAGTADLAVTGIVHAHLAPDVARYRALRGESEPLGTPVLPDRLHELAERHGYRALVSCARPDPAGTLDARFVPARAVRRRWLRSPWPVGDHDGPRANDPLAGGRRRWVAERVRRFAAARLPTYMVPASIAVVDSLPLSPNGKVDRETLVRQTPRPAPPASSRPPSGPKERAVAEVWRDVIGCPLPDATADFFDIGGTSLLAIQVVVALRGRGLSLRPQQVFEARTVERVAEVLTEVCAPTTEPVRPPKTQGTMTSRGWAGARRVLLTGATGTLGVHLLDGLLRRTDGPRITCLVRAPEEAAALRRLREHYRWHFPKTTFAEFDRRVDTVAGDLREPSLGLPEVRLDELGEECDHILHAAADVRHVAERDDIFATNVDGTRRLLDLAVQGTPAAVHFISTIGVAGRTDAGPATLDEESLDIGQRPTEAYSASKIEAERLVRRFLAEGTGTVLRVGTVAPHSRTGRFQRDLDAHFFSRYLRATLELGLAADWPGRGFALIPVDSMAAAVLALAGEPHSRGRTYHIQTPHRLSHYDIVRVLHALGYPIRLVVADEFAELALQVDDPDGENAANIGRLLPLLEPPGGAAVRLDHSRTGSVLAELGIEFPPPTTAYLARFVRHGTDIGYLPAPPRGWIDATLPEVLTTGEEE